MADRPKPPPPRSASGIQEDRGVPSRRDPRAEPDTPVPVVPSAGSSSKQTLARPHVLPQLSNVPVPTGALAPPVSKPQPQSSGRNDFVLQSMAPPRIHEEEDVEQTRAGATIVGAPAYRPSAGTSTKKAYLTVIAGSRAGEMFRLEEDETILGRGPQSTIHLDSDGVSRRHARIVRQGDDYLAEDLKSTNGTWCNEKRITFHRLIDGDKLQIGTEVIVRFNFHDELEAGLQQQLYESAHRDPLTRAYNRKHFGERLRSEIGHAVRHRTQLSLILFDIDHFKKVNDTFGHPGGDAVLRAISGAILRVIRVEDVFARIGGEEFALLARGIDGKNGVLFAERLRRGIERLQIPWEGRAIPVTSSFGVATVAEMPQPPEEDALVALADKRLYEAKTGGRNRVVGPVT
jgi:diguanylate cyclase (GGDEF)-like protein